MLSLLLVTTLTGAPAPVAPAPLCSPTVQDDDRRAEFEEKRAAAKGDKDALWDVHKWCTAFGMEREGNSILKEILRLDDGDDRAHELLGHIKYDGQWFTTEKKLEAYKKKEGADAARREREEAEAKGLVEYEGGWADPADIPFLEKGWVKNDAGEWVDPVVQQRLDEGWRRQDLTWIAPDEFEQLDAGLWKVGDSWMPLAAADELHARLETPWVIPVEGMELHTTLPRDVALQAADHMKRSLQEVRRFFGSQPVEPMKVVLVRSLDQFNEVGTAGDDFGLSAVTFGFLGTGPREADGRIVPVGAGYWDMEGENGAAYGVHSARYAASLAFVDAMDPSPKATAAPKKRSQRGEGLDLGTFYNEKKLPLVLYHGLAVYGARYFVDRAAPAGGDAYWARKWSLQNLSNQGGLRAPATTLTFPFLQGNELSPDAGQTLLEAGAMIAFILDGENEEVSAAHDAWKEAWNSGNDLEKPTQALFQALATNWEAFKTFAQG